MSYERPPDSQPRGDRPTREWIQLAAAVVGLLAAIAAGTFGILANKAKVDAQVTTSTAQKQAGAAQAQIDNLNKQLAQEQATTEDLRSQLAAQSSTAPAAPLTGSDPADLPGNRDDRSVGAYSAQVDNLRQAGRLITPQAIFGGLSR